jgi:hypothetical protein
MYVLDCIVGRVVGCEVEIAVGRRQVWWDVCIGLHSRACSGVWCGAVCMGSRVGTTAHLVDAAIAASKVHGLLLGVRLAAVERNRQPKGS